jgi:hypothetical protein
METILMLERLHIQPEFVASDFSTDASEWWAETTDPKAEIGEICVAHFDRDEIWRMKLTGLVVTGEGSIGYIPRDRVVETMGWPAVLRIERVAGEECKAKMDGAWPPMVEEY